MERPIRTTRFRTPVFRAAAAVLSLLLGLGILEFVLRSVGAGEGFPSGTRMLLRSSDQDVMYQCYPSNPRGEFRPVPEVWAGDWVLLRWGEMPTRLPLEQLGETPWCIEVRRSRNGLRDRDYAPFPAPGTIRVLGMGDSFAVGDGVPLESSLFKRIESLLGDGFEVLNCAKSGMDTAQEARLLKSYAVKFNGSRAIVVFVPNDVRLTPELEERKHRIHDLIDFTPGGSTAGHEPGLRLLQILRSQAAIRRARRESIQWYGDCYDEAHNSENLKALAADLRSMAGLPGCRVALVIFPLLDGFESAYPFVAIHEKVRALAVVAGIPVLDLSESFMGLDPSTLWVHPVDHHPNSRAHALAAEAIVGWLRRDVPGFLER